MNSLNTTDAGNFEVVTSSTGEVCLRFIAGKESSFSNEEDVLNKEKYLAASLVNFFSTVNLSATNRLLIEKLNFTTRNTKLSNSRSFKVESTETITVLNFPSIPSNIEVEFKKTTKNYLFNAVKVENTYFLPKTKDGSLVSGNVNEEEEKELFDALNAVLQRSKTSINDFATKLVNKVNTRYLWHPFISKYDDLNAYTALVECKAIDEKCNNLASHICDEVTSLCTPDSKNVPEHLFTFANYTLTENAEGDTVDVALYIKLDPKVTGKAGFTVADELVLLAYSSSHVLKRQKCGTLAFECVDGPNMVFMTQYDLDSTCVITLKDTEVSEKFDSLMSLLGSRIAKTLFSKEARTKYFNSSSDIISALFTKDVDKLSFKRSYMKNVDKIPPIVNSFNRKHSLKTFLNTMHYLDQNTGRKLKVQVDGKWHHITQVGTILGFVDSGLSITVDKSLNLITGVRSS